MKVDSFAIEELLRSIGSLDDEADIDEYVYNEFSIDFDQFSKVVETLLPLINLGTSSLTKKSYKGFGKDGMFYIKQEIE